MSDYNKGFWTDEVAQAIIKICREYKILTVIDPKKPPLIRWTGCNYIKPNTIEAAVLTNTSDKSRHAIEIMNAIKCDGVIITNGGDGVYGLTKETIEYKSPYRLHTKEVNSVIGAGDAFISMLTLGLSHGFDAQEAAAIAFEAGAVYVTARHNKPITIQEIIRRADPLNGKIIKDVSFLKNSKTTFTNGCFDIIHIGHINTLRFAKQQNDILVVGVNSDASVKRLKGKKRPINDEKTRCQMLAALDCVDYVVIFDEDTPLTLIDALQPEIVVKGGDYKASEIVCGKAKVLISPYVDGFSTTNLIDKLTT